MRFLRAETKLANILADLGFSARHYFEIFRNLKIFVWARRNLTFNFCVRELNIQTVFPSQISIEYNVFASIRLKPSTSNFRHHNKQIPNTYEALITLPGIGRSTAGAILSLSRIEPKAILDGNVKRVLSRFYSVQVVLFFLYGNATAIRRFCGRFCVCLVNIL